MSYLRTLIAIVLLAAGLSAEPVYLSAHGKTFHVSTHCMSLSRATHVFTAERAEAEAHGLRQCGICYRAKASGKKSPTAPAWAKEMEPAK